MSEERRTRGVDIEVWGEGGLRGPPVLILPSGAEPTLMKWASPGLY